jgi:hypothetical protein
VASLGLAGSTGLAQSLPPAGLSRPADPACANSLSAVGAVVPGISYDSLAALLSALAGCNPELGQGIARAARNLASVNDLNVGSVVFGTAPLVDSAVFAASRDVALSGSASVLMRVLGVRTLFYYVERGRTPSYGDIVALPRGVTGCSFPAPSDIPPLVTVGDFTPLPPDANSQIRDVARAIQGDGAADANLLSASYCVLEAWRARTGRPGNPHWPFSASQLTVDYVCGNRFRIRNTRPAETVLEWNVGELPLKRVAIAQPGTGETYGERLLDASAAGDLKLYYDGDLAITRQNLGTLCP